VMHTWSGTKEDLLLDEKNYENVGPRLVRAGYVVAAIDGCFHGERIGRGPNDTRNPPGQSASSIKQKQQQSLMGLYLWQGRTLWGMMLREQQCLLDYLQTRREVNPAQMGATGMSLGNTTAWWLAALDDRVRAVVGVACFTRLEQLIAHGQVQAHGLYYFVPGMLRHFDTEAVFAVVAPRPMLQLNGDGDTTCPPDGIEMLERKIDGVYRLHGQPENFRSVIYRGTGHEYLPEMKDEMVRWFEKHLPVK
jgi:dienelactone hydrolase